MFQLSGPVLENSDESEPDPGFQSNLAAAQVLWPPTDPEEVKRQVEIRHVHKPLTSLVQNLSDQMLQINTCLSAASVSVPDAAPSVHEH